ncbi:hypothetical protein ANANG_G00286100 [Anguilla anguilla]|uniref:Protein-serine/threonine phosphatase n=1 Tax=Anguilla anguilla TaxID=7936 RepID=A0A9D3LSN0_ANGAN|nr:hypothetical protein ANANG_G00286100 [Anguilla anguilla]
MEDVHGLLQLPARGRHRRREDLLLPRRPVPGPAVDGAGSAGDAPHGRAGPGAAVRPALGRPGQGRAGLGRERPRVSFTFGADVVAKFLHKHDMDLICRAHQVVEDGYEFFAATAGHSVLRPQLLRRVRQRRRHDERGRDPHVLLPDPEACG